MVAAGEYLSRPTALGKADVVVPLDGRRGRFRRALEMLGTGRTEHLLVVGSDVEPGDFACLDVPSGALLFGDERAFRTKDEARVARKVADERGFRSVIVVTSWYHLRRAGKLFREAFEGSGVELMFEASGRDPFTAHDWWKSYIGRKCVVTEYLGLLL